jgi:dihydropteroate synthase
VYKRQEYYGADIVNDVSGGEFDKKMYGLVASKGVAYILMHMKGRPETMQDKPRYNDVMDEITYWLSVRVKRLIKEGLKDIIIDPGFGFGKTLEHNYTILKNLDRFQVLGLPVLAGLSRKSMIWKKLSISPSEALNGTSILNTIALQKGASILRVHDVKEAKELICLFNAVNTES